MSIIKLLNNKVSRTLFTTPSHSQHAQFSKNLSSFYEVDYSEIEGFDNLSNPKKSILLSQAKTSEIMGAKQTFYITQGATTAVLAAMKALIKPTERVLVARNCHKSVYNGLILTAAYVDWFMPETDGEWGIYTEIDPKKLDLALKLNQYKALIITSPTYEGVNSNIAEISKLCKKYGTYLIVDEAHGILNNFSEILPNTALEEGADISINSLHKTAGALNQTAILNVSKNIQNIELENIQKAINLFQTSSPSYPLLSNIEACIGYLNSKEGKKEIDNLLLNIEKFKTELKDSGVEFFENNDPTKIVLRKKGISGHKLSDILFDKFNIEDEMNNNICALYLTGIGTTKQKLDKLKSSLKNVEINSAYEFKTKDFQPYPMVKLQPIEAFNKNYQYVNRENSELKISNQTIIPYPPGIGLLYPGEAIQKWHLDYLDDDVEVIQ